MGDLTILLQKVERGEAQATEEFATLIYDELRALAAQQMSRESAEHTLQPTALVHEAWLRLGGDQQPNWKNRAHFFGAAAEAMRRILISRARRRRALRRGGDQERLNAEDLNLAVTAPDDDRLRSVNEALDKLAALDARKAELVKLRYFGGLTLDEAARRLNISEPTAKRWWRFARAWLYEEIPPRPSH